MLEEMKMKRWVDVRKRANMHVFIDLPTTVEPLYSGHAL